VIRDTPMSLARRRCGSDKIPYSLECRGLEVWGSWTNARGGRFSWEKGRRAAKKS